MLIPTSPFRNFLTAPKHATTAPSLMTSRVRTDLTLLRVDYWVRPAPSQSVLCLGHWTYCAIPLTRNFVTNILKMLLVEHAHCKLVQDLKVCRILGRNEAWEPLGKTPAGEWRILCLCPKVRVVNDSHLPLSDTCFSEFSHLVYAKFIPFCLTCFKPKQK